MPQPSALSDDEDREVMRAKFNPGSYEATAAGCRCPILDNNHGMWKPWPGDWWVNGDCPLHGVVSAEG